MTDPGGSSARFTTPGPIRVGIIGASTSGWARNAHLPAIATIPGLEVVAVSTTRQESARATADAFGVPDAYSDADELLRSEAVDLVVVAVRVDRHYDLLQKVVRSGKPVYSEWPSGASAAQTRRLRDDFAAAGVYAATGLQARSAPAIAFVRDLVQDGYVGRVLSSTLVGSADPWGDTADSDLTYLHDESLGGTMATIPFAHAIDGLCSVLGEFAAVSAMTAIQRPIVPVLGTERTLERTTPDQLLVTGRLTDGTMVSAHYRGGRTAGTDLHWEINGNEGTILVTAPSGSLQLSPLTVFGASRGQNDLSELPIPARYVHADPSLRYPAAVVAEALLRVESDLRHGTACAPTFDDAVTRKDFVDAVRRAADTGRVQHLG